MINRNIERLSYIIEETTTKYNTKDIKELRKIQSKKSAKYTELINGDSWKCLENFCNKTEELFGIDNVQLLSFSGTGYNILYSCLCIKVFDELLGE